VKCFASAVIATAICLSACSTAGVSEFKGPDGTSVKTAKCVSSAQQCYAMASQSCSGGGTYRVISSESHAGGIIADVLPGPATWYSMTYTCGPSDGQLASFPFGGPQPAMPNFTRSQPVTTNCTSYGHSTNCTTQ
jgi:hypothetical protein